MTDPKWCPECSEPWKRGRKSCDCGYRLKSVADDPRNDPYHGRCDFTTGNERCPLPGTISDTTRADKGTRFQCRFHAAIPGDFVRGAQVLEAIKRGELRIEKTDWREIAIAEVMNRRPRAAA